MMATHEARPACIALAGPTASGKSAASLAIAQRWPVEIISVDSALVYRGMDIGTAKPSAAERAAVPHHLIDCIDPTRAYSAAQFVADELERCVREHDLVARLDVQIVAIGPPLQAIAADLTPIGAVDAAQDRDLVACADGEVDYFLADSAGVSKRQSFKPFDGVAPRQMDFLFGGVSVVLAETLGSMASYLCIDTSKFYCVGLEINANHLRGLRSGRVTAVATSLTAMCSRVARCRTSAPCCGPCRRAGWRPLTWRT